MQNDPTYTDGSSVYPGEYVPLFKENDFHKAIKYPYKNEASGLPVNIDESGDSYKIELPVPGVERENLLVKICENVLSVSVIHKNDEPDKQREIQLREFTFDGCFTRKIVLPDDADSVFISAACKSGILHLHIPKSRRRVKRVDTKIAVY